MAAVNIGIIGIGNIGSAHAVSIYNGNIPGLNLTAVCDINPTCLDWADKQFSNVKLFNNSNDLINHKSVDAVIIATPHYEHTNIGIAAFKKGLHVLCEKPIAVYTKQALQLNEVAKQSGKVFSVMFNQRTDPLFHTVRKLVQDGAIGDIMRMLWVVTNWYRTQEYYDSSDWRATWNGEGGGVLLNQAVHNIDLWQWIIGMPSNILGFCNFGKYHDIEVEDEVTIYAGYNNQDHNVDTTAVFITSTGEYPGTNRLEITGTKGKFVAEDGKLHMWQNNDTNTDSTFTQVKLERPTQLHAHNAILHNFANAILYNEPLIAPGYDGINSLEIANAALLSTWQHTSVDLPIDQNIYHSMLKEKIKTSKNVQLHCSCAPKGEYRNRWSVKW